MKHRDIVFKCVVWPADDEDNLKELGYNRLCLDVLAVVSFYPCRDERVPDPSLHVNLPNGRHTVCGITVDEFRALRQAAGTSERALNFFPFSLQ